MRTVAILLLCCSLGYTEEIAVSKSDGNISEPDTKTITIPLSEIWAMDMPGTKPMIRGMREGKFVSEEGPLLDIIRRRKFNDPAAVHNGFAVVGTGMEALKNAYNVLVKHERPKDMFTVGEDLSIVFFTWRSIRYIHLHDVKRSGN
jgi:hypothetical protein